MDTSFQLSTYYPIFLYLAAIVGLAITILILAHVVGPRKNTKVKLMPYESGMDPIGNAWQRFDIKYYLIAITFLVFDVELLFLYPWAASANKKEAVFPAEMRDTIFWSVIVFIVILVIAYLYDLKKGVFRWRR